jgi:hypothetical protein
MTRRTKFILLSPLFVTGFLLLIALGGEIVRQLWNWLLPPLLGLPEVTFWQALGLLALSRILVGGFGLGGNSHDRSRRCDRGSDRIAERIADRVADRVAERVERMTPEQRERFRQRLRERGFDVGDAAGGIS